MLKSLSRNIVARDGRYITKIYESKFPIILLDFLRAMLSIMSFKPQLEFVDVKSRIKNEVIARHMIKGIGTSKIIKYSDNHIVETFIHGKTVDEFLERTKNTGISCELGEFAGKLHKNGFALIDNRPKNYIITKQNKIFRVDLEMFKMQASEFDKMCDLLSFAESFDDNNIKSSFLEGHKKFCDCGYNSYIGLLSKLFLRIITYLE